MLHDIEASESNLIRLVHSIDMVSQDPTVYKAELRASADQLFRPVIFKIGDLVQWKQGLKNRSFPAFGEPAVITQVLDKPIYDPSEADACSPFFREPLTIVIAVLHDGNLREHHADGRRYELFQE